MPERSLISIEDLYVKRMVSRLGRHIKQIPSRTARICECNKMEIGSIVRSQCCFTLEPRVTSS